MSLQGISLKKILLGLTALLAFLSCLLYTSKANYIAFLLEEKSPSAIKN